MVRRVRVLQGLYLAEMEGTHMPFTHKIRFHAFRKEWLFYFRVQPKREVLHYGVGNRCHDGRYVLFLDYDHTPLSWIREEITLLQEYYNVGPCYLFKTKHGIHVISLEKFHLRELISIMGATSIDQNYLTVPLMGGAKIWILRQSEKKGETITYLGKQHADTILPREHSRAHAEYLGRFCGVPKRDLPRENLDNGKDLILGYYRISEPNN